MRRPGRICVLADSHAAALKRGWASVKSEYPETDLTFFAGTAAEWGSMRVVDGQLAPESAILREQFGRTTHGMTEIAGDFDAYLICSLGLAISFALKLCARQEQKDWANLRTAVAWHIANGHCAHVLGRLREITAKPTLLLAAPFQPRKFCAFSPSLDQETSVAARTIFFEECEALAAKHNAAFLPQPKSTWAVNGVTTRMKFASQELLNGKEDRRHCTAEYGAIVLKSVFARGFAAD